VVRSTALRTDWSCGQPRACPRRNTNELAPGYQKNHGNSVSIGLTGVIPLAPMYVNRAYLLHEGCIVSSHSEISHINVSARANEITQAFG
jgi:hypothetical protein